MTWELISKHNSISNTVTGAAVTNQIAGALVDRILSAAKNGENFKVRTYVTI
jgi:hypothetical protein